MPNINFDEKKLREIADEQVDNLRFDLSLDPEWRERLFNSPKDVKHPIEENFYGLSEESKRAGLRFAAFNEGWTEDGYVVFGIMSIDFPDIIEYTTNNPEVI